MTTDQCVIEQTRCWIETVVVAHNFCPFAARELKRDSVRYRVLRDIALEPCLLALAEECLTLDREPHTETTLLILAGGFQDFHVYLELLEIAGDLLLDQGYEGVYQLASFHPDYCFDGADPQDPANYTNRSPYPMLHILRETSIERALLDYPQAEQIPERNIETARRQGLARMQALLAACREPNE